jgi:hypothetical protein
MAAPEWILGLLLGLALGGTAVYFATRRQPGLARSESATPLEQSVEGDYRIFTARSEPRKFSRESVTPNYHILHGPNEDDADRGQGPSIILES